MQNLLKNPGMFFLASLSAVSTQAFGDSADLENLADTIVSDYPAVHSYIEDLNSSSMDRICANDFAQIQDSDELQILLNLSANIQNNAQHICVIRELQSMIGFSEAHGNQNPGSFMSEQ